MKFYEFFFIFYYDVGKKKVLHDFLVLFIYNTPDSRPSIHPVFHISILEPSTPNLFPSCKPTPDPLVILDGEPEYEILEIDSKVNRCRRCRLQYLVCWAGYKGTDEETSWLSASELGHALEVISDFHQAYPEKPRPRP